MQVLAHVVRAVVVAGKEPVVGPETPVLRDDVVQTGVPMEYHENVVRQVEGAKHVGVVRVALCSVQERPEAIDLDEPKASEDRIEAYGQVQDVQG